MAPAEAKAFSAVGTSCFDLLGLTAVVAVVGGGLVVAEVENAVGEAVAVAGDVAVAVASVQRFGQFSPSSPPSRC